MNGLLHDPPQKRGDRANPCTVLNLMDAASFLNRKESACDLFKLSVPWTALQVTRNVELSRDGRLRTFPSS